MDWAIIKQIISKNNWMWLYNIYVSNILIRQIRCRFYKNIWWIKLRRIVVMIYKLFNIFYKKDRETKILNIYGIMRWEGRSYLYKWDSWKPI